MERLLREGLVERDGLSFYESVDGSGELVLVTIRGRLACRHGTAIRVDKKIETRRGRANRLEVRTRYYQYHAWIRSRPGRPRRDLIRYDNSGEHGGRLHRHRFDAAGRSLDPEYVALDEMPTLDEFIREALAMAG